MNHNFENTLAILICLYTLKLVHQNVLLGGSLNTRGGARIRNPAQTD